VAKKKTLSIGEFIRTTRLKKGILLFPICGGGNDRPAPPFTDGKKAKYIHEKNLPHIGGGALWASRSISFRELNKPAALVPAHFAGLLP